MVLGDQNHVGAARDPGVEGDPAGVAAHDLDDQDPVVALGGGVQPIDRVGRDLDSGLEAEGAVGSREVVVDRLRDADHPHAVLVQPIGYAERVLATDRDQCLDPMRLHARADQLEPVLPPVGVGPRSSEDRASPGQNAARGLEIERRGLALDHATPAVPVAKKLMAVGALSLANRRPDHGVESGAVAATGQHTYSQLRPPSRSTSRGQGIGPPSPPEIMGPRLMAPAPDHALLYDADCGFCKRSLDRILRWDRRGRLRAVPIQGSEGDRLLAALPPERRLDSWHLVGPGGDLYSAGSAAPLLLRLLPGGAALAALLAAFPALTDAAYGWVAAHRDLLGRFLVLGMALVIAGCGSTVQDGARLTVYASVPQQGPEGAVGRDLITGMERALERAGGEAGGVPVSLVQLDDTVAFKPGEGPRRWTQVQVAANARTATEDSTTVAYIGEASSEATRVSAAITNKAGILQLSPGPVERELLADPGGNDVPREFQPSGERTLGTLVAEGAELDPGAAEQTGEEAMALVLDSIEEAGDPLDRGSVQRAFYATADRDSALGLYTIDPVGRAAFADGSGSGAP